MIWPKYKPKYPVQGITAIVLFDYFYKK